MRRLTMLAAALLSAAGAAAQPEIVREGLPSGPAAGQVLFHTYCASCHGVSGEGNGPVATSLRKPPADLTRLSEKYGLPLPEDVLAEFIDGRRNVASHGPREMPVWGERFFRREPATPSSEPAKQRTIHAILKYVETLQRAPDAPSDTTEED